MEEVSSTPVRLASYAFIHVQMTTALVTNKTQKYYNEISPKYDNLEVYFTVLFFLFVHLD